MNKKEKSEKIEWHSFEQIFKGVQKKKEFKNSYDMELSRLRLARQIRELRTRKKLTQKVVAEKAGMPQSVIARVESGAQGVSLDTLGKIAHAFGKRVQLV